MKPIILAVEYDGELGILAFDEPHQAIGHMVKELEGYFDGDLPRTKRPETEADIWRVINAHGVPLNFRILDTRISDRSLF